MNRTGSGVSDFVWLLCLFERNAGTQIDWKSGGGTSYSGTCECVCRDPPVWHCRYYQGTAWIYDHLSDMDESDEAVGRCGRNRIE